MEERDVFQWLIYYALLSMFPLLTRDKLVIPYAALYGLFVLLYHAPGGKKDAGASNSILSILKSFVFACSLVIHVVYLTVSPPDKYPFLFEAVIMSLCFSQFVVISIYMNLRQWAPSKLSSQGDTKKKKSLWFSLARDTRLQNTCWAPREIRTDSNIFLYCISRILVSVLILTIQQLLIS